MYRSDEQFLYFSRAGVGDRGGEGATVDRVVRHARDVRERKARERERRDRAVGKRDMVDRAGRATRTTGSAAIEHVAVGQLQQQIGRGVARYERSQGLPVGADFPELVVALIAENERAICVGDETDDFFNVDRAAARRFTDRATQIYKLIPGDVQRPLGDIVNELDYPELEDDDDSTTESR